MRKNIFNLAVLIIFILISGLSNAFAQRAVFITEPVTGSVVSSPVKICMDTRQLKVEAARNDVKEGNGHHHLVLDVPLPSDFKNSIPKNSNFIHMGNGVTCKTLHLEPGKHVIRALFGYANHIPYYPPITDTVVITVKP